MIGLMALPITAMALCSVGYPSVEQESKVAVGIVVARAEREQALQEDRDDPQGVTAYVYTARIIESARGDMSGVIKIRNDNTSSRFPFELGAEYLLFLHKGSGEEFWVDSCGNSGPLAERQALLARLKEEGTSR